MPITSRKVFSIYRTLDRDQVRFVLDKIIEGSYNLEEWLNRLKRIAFMDLLGDETREQAGRLSITFGILAAVTLALSILRPVLFFFPIGFGIIGAYFLSLYMSLLKIDITNHMRLFLVPLLEKLKDRLSEGSTISLKMDFSSPVTADKLIQTVESDKARSIKVYKHHWIDGELSLNDGTVLSWNAEDVVNQSKSKLADTAENFKLKEYSIKHLLAMTMKMPSSHFTPVDEEIPEEEGRYIVNLSAESKSESLQQGLDPAVFLDLLEQGYAKLKPTHPVSG